MLFWPHSDVSKRWRQMSHDMTKPAKLVCTQRRLRSAWASAQSDQSSLCAQWAAKDPRFLHADSEDSDQPGHRTVKTLIRLGRCPGWSESSLGTQPLCWFCHEAAHMFIGFVKLELIWAMSWENLFMLSVNNHAVWSTLLLFTAYIV